MKEYKYNSTDTIVALATPRGKGAIAIVRISGEAALEVSGELVKDPQRLHNQVSRHLHMVDILLEDECILDRALCAVYRKPRSYTGENLVEIFLHNSPYIVAKTVERCCQYGARIAEPGEFTLRAFLNGRLDLAQAEAVADLVAANSVASHRVAILQRDGALSRRIRSIRDKLIEICSMVELEIDFSDQDLPVVDRSRTCSILDGVEADLKILEGSYSQGRLAREGALVAIAGAPNVGKSTLFNALLGEDRAIVHETPGTTRDAVEGVVEWEGLAIRLVDTAGQAEQFSGPDEKAVKRASKTIRGADIILWVMDLTDQVPITPPDEIADRTVAVGNKVDLVEDKKIAIKFDFIRTSALKGWGLKEVKLAVLQNLVQGDTAELGEGILCRERHLEAVRKGLRALNDAKRVLQENLGDELLATDLREAADCLGEVIGEVTPDDVLNRIFADFCIGK